jgi:hypothetical protein
MSPKSDATAEAAGAKLTGSVLGGDMSEKVLSGDTNWRNVLFTVGCGKSHFTSSKPGGGGLNVRSCAAIASSSGTAGVGV